MNSSNNGSTKRTKFKLKTDSDDKDSSWRFDNTKKLEKGGPWYLCVKETGGKCDLDLWN